MSSAPSIVRRSARRNAGGTGADIAAARRVIETEARGLQELLASLDGSFTAALDKLASPEGRIVVTGMGKSGHVARKIAATLASTGSPAMFVHPGEASHGDLGMITPEDAVLALSNSGETAELTDLIVYTRRFGIPLVAMTRNAMGTLAAEADVALVLPESEEACPMGLAPTTSTTAMLALGDAIAVALLERKGFSPLKFHDFHPGGRLGRQLRRVRDLMHAGDEVPLVAPETVMSEVLIEMTAKRFGCVGVIDASRRLLGVITDGDLRRHMAPDLIAATAGTVMTADPTTLSPDALAAEALGLMNERSITNLFVVDGGQPVGIIHIHDCLREGVA
ncbi:MAG: KpsF/GutQ family sugar-phosphate isomerase [Acetobacterales bacterium]